MKTERKLNSTTAKKPKRMRNKMRLNDEIENK
jgi:hypothetical protein